MCRVRRGVRDADLRCYGVIFAHDCQTLSFRFFVYADYRPSDFPPLPLFFTFFFRFITPLRHAFRLTLTPIRDYAHAAFSLPL